MVWLGVHTMTQTEGDATTGGVHSPTGAVFAKLNVNYKEHAKHTSAVSELIRLGEKWQRSCMKGQAQRFSRTIQ